MRITFLDDEPEIFPLQYGGKARFITSMSRALAKDGNDVRILSRSIRGPGKFSLEGVSYELLQGYSAPSVIAAAARDSDALSVHTCSFTSPLMWESDCRIVNHLHDVIFATCDAGSHLDKAMAGNWSRIYAPSEFAARTFRNAAQWSGLKERIEVIERGVDTEMFRPDAEKKRHALLFPNRLGAGKGEEKLDALGRNLKKDYADLEIFACGERGSEHVKPLGWLATEMMPAAYSGAGLTLVLSTLPESFSQVTVESIACGTPVLTYRFGNLANLADTVPGVYACEPSLEDVTDGVRRIFENREEVAADVERGMKLIRERYCLTRAKDGFVRSLETAPRQSGLPRPSFSLPSEPVYFTLPTSALYENCAYVPSAEGCRRIGLNREEKSVLQSILCAKPASEVGGSAKILDSLVEKGLVVKCP